MFNSEDLNLDNDIFQVPWEIPQQNVTPQPLKKLSPKPIVIRTPIKRKFPGPAGLLHFKVVKNEQSGDPHEIPCSQSSMQIFEGAWEQMLKDFQLLNNRELCLPDKYNIEWIKTKAKSNQLINKKAPFLAGVIHEIKTQTLPVIILLKDRTGQINATVVKNLYEDYQKHLVKGSVIILQQVGVLTTSTSNYYLTITSNNLIAIYNHHNVVRLRKYTVDEYWKNIASVKSRFCNDRNQKCTIIRREPVTSWKFPHEAIK